MPIIEVQCYSGYRADEKPMSFSLGDTEYVVDKVIDQWRSPGFEFFKVLADDERVYLLKHDNIKSEWALEKILNK